MKLTEEECYKIMEDHFMLDNLRHHCEIVSKIAHFLAVELNKKGLFLDPELARIGGLLHDITKPYDIFLKPYSKQSREAVENSSPEKLERIRKSWEDMKKRYNIKEDDKHNISGGKLIRELGYDKVAVIVENHTIPNKEGEVREADLVFHADNVAKHEVTSIQERLGEWAERTGRKLTKELLGECLEVEKKIFSKLDFSPDELKQKMEEEGII